jgi:hypothetical protein
VKKAAEEKISAMWNDLRDFANLMQDKHFVVINVAPRSFSSGNKLSLLVYEAPEKEDQ